MHTSRLAVAAIVLATGITPGVARAQNAFRDVSGFTTNNLPRNDDHATGDRQDLGFGVNFFGVNATGVFVSNNGYVTFNSPDGTFTPFGLTGGVPQPLIAPFFADVDTRPDNSALTTWGTGTVDGHNAFGVDWDGVGYFGNHGDKLNTFQLVMIDRSDTGTGNFDFEFNYNNVLWETGDASGGSNGFGGSCAHAGYSNGGSGDENVSGELPGSGVCGALLNGGPNALVEGSQGSNVAGRYVFEVRNGAVTVPPTTTTPEPGSLALLGTGLVSLIPVVRRRR